MPDVAPFPASIRMGGFDVGLVAVADTSVKKVAEVVEEADQQDTKLKNDQVAETSTPEKEG
jgi:hypothetical protein